MRIGALTVLAVAAAAAPAHATTLVRASTTACDAEARSATFEGDARTRPGADRLQMRFALKTLVEGRWARVKAPGFGEWQTSEAGVARYVYAKRVENLPAPGSYRVRVAVRWLDVQGATLARRARRSPVCRIPDPRADLRAVSVSARPGGWAVLVRNAGRSAAESFDVAAAMGGTAGAVRRVERLGAGEERAVVFDGPCGTWVRVTVDAADAVDERDEGDNVLEAPCPFVR